MAGSRETASEHGRFLTSPTGRRPRIAIALPSFERRAFRELAPATCEVEPHRDAVHVVPSGEFDIAVVPSVDARLRELHDAGFHRLILDLRQVTFIEVRALRLILQWSDAARADGTATFEVIPGPPHVQRIFALTDTADRVAFLTR